MGLFIFRFWPALIPFLIYVLWFVLVRHKAISEGKPLPKFREGPWYRIILSTLFIAAGCFIILGSLAEKKKGRYVPSQVIDGRIIPAHVRDDTNKTATEDK